MEVAKTKEPSNLVIEFIPGRVPTLFLYDENDKQVDSIVLEDYSYTELHELIASRLLTGGPPAKATKKDGKAAAAAVPKQAGKAAAAAVPKQAASAATNATVNPVFKTTHPINEDATVTVNLPQGGGLRGHLPRGGGAAFRGDRHAPTHRRGRRRRRRRHRQGDAAGGGEGGGAGHRQQSDLPLSGIELSR